MPDTDGQRNTLSDAAAFLASVPGRHSLVAIHPDTAAIEARIFSQAEMDAARAWIAERNGTYNLYWSPNEPAAHARSASKLTKAEIGRVRFLHVDLDPAHDADLDTERARLRAAVDAAPEARGAMAVDSGGGFGLFWPVADDMAHDEAERANKALAARLGGDRSAWNIDRIMRLPGTLNLPTAKKRARGRVHAVPAKLLRSAPAGYSVDASTFAHLPLPMSATTTEADGARYQEAAETIALSGWQTATWHSLTPDERGRLTHALQRSVRLDAAFRGARATGDTSRSGHIMAIAAGAKEEGLTAADYALLLACAPALADWEKDLRQAARAWLRSAEPADPMRWFAPTEAGGVETTIWDVGPDGLLTKPGGTLSVAEQIQWTDAATQPDDYEPPAMGWVVLNVIPRNEVSFVYGQGGTGKTLLFMQLAICLATGRPWLGQETAQKLRAGAFWCEDKPDEIARRHRGIMRAMNLQFQDLGGRYIYASRRGHDNTLAVFDRQTGEMKLTAFFWEVRRSIIENRLDVLILDTLMDIYGGNEIDRAQVNAFCKRCLTRLEQETGCTIVVLAHPSRAGIASGDNSSGSTHWENAVRSRSAFAFVGKPGDAAHNPNLREFSVKKLNQGPRSTKLLVEYRVGAFWLVAGKVTAQGVTPGAGLATPSLGDALESAIAQAVVAAGPVAMSLSRQGAYAPKVLRQTGAEAIGAFGADDIEAGIRRMLAKGALREDTVGVRAGRKPVVGFVLVPEKMHAEPPPDIFD